MIKLLCKTVFWYIFLFSIFTFLKRDMETERWLSVLSLALASLFVTGVIAGQYVPRRLLGGYLFVMHLFGAYMLYHAIEFNTGEHFGIYVGDGDFYHSFAEEALNTSFGEAFPESMGLDDCGFPAILYLLYLPFRNQAIFFHIMLVVNSVIVALSGVVFYRTALLMMREKYAVFGMLIFGLSTYSLFSTVHFLKENIFIFIIVMAFYYLVKTALFHGVGNKIALGIWAGLPLFFRLPIPFVFFCSYCAGWISPRKFARYFPLFAILGVLFLLVGLDPFLRRLGLADGLQFILAVSSARSETGGMGLGLGFAVQVLGALFGPFPNFSAKPGSEVLLLYPFYLLFKCFLAYYFFRGFWRLFRAGSALFQIFFVYAFLNILMLVLSFVALDMRYHLTLYPLFLLVAMYGMMPAAAPRLWHRIIQAGYDIFVIGIIIFYNLR